MSDHRFSFPASVVAGKGRIDVHDVMLLRRYTFPDGIAGIDDAEAMLALHRLCPEQCPEWSRYFIEALAHYIVYRATPGGTLDEDNADWLMQTLARNGIVSTPLELELLLHAMELASEIPDMLSAFALDQLRAALSADRHCACAAARPPSETITDHDLAFVLRILRPAVDHGRLILSPREAAVLREIDLLTVASQNHPVWTQMMAQLITLDRPGEPLRPEAWMLTNTDEPLRDEWAA